VQVAIVPIHYLSHPQPLAAMEMVTASEIAAVVVTAAVMGTVTATKMVL